MYVPPAIILDRSIETDKRRPPAVIVSWLLITPRKSSIVEPLTTGLPFHGGMSFVTVDLSASIPVEFHYGERERDVIVSVLSEDKMISIL